MSGVEIPMAGLFNFAGQLGALVEEFSGMVQSNEEVQAAIDMPWMDGTMQHAASDFEGSWDSRRAELLEQLMNYMETVQGVMERWAGYDDTMGMSFEEYLENTPDGQAKLDEITSQTAEGDALWEGTEEKAQVDEQVADLERQIDEMSPEELQAYMHDNGIPVDENDPHSVPPHPDDDPLFASEDQPVHIGTVPQPDLPMVADPSFDSFQNEPPAVTPDAPVHIGTFPQPDLPMVADPSFDSFQAEPPAVTGDAAVDPTGSPQVIPEKGLITPPPPPADTTGSSGSSGDLDAAIQDFNSSVQDLNGSVQNLFDSGTNVVSELHALAYSFEMGSDFGSAFTGIEPAIDMAVAEYNSFAQQNQLPLVVCADIHTLLGTQS
ncbi:hypothetical protein [Agrococcus casei]|uniref:hypothetical protein n=1 Tax=Agrococcus casei TaxID=343512 RepID=UPI003F939155